MSSTWIVRTGAYSMTPNEFSVWPENFTGDGSERIACWIQTEANARLIAAAPDLLEACKVALRHIDFHTSIDSAIHVRRVLHDVIAKAEVAK